MRPVAGSTLSVVVTASGRVAGVNGPEDSGVVIYVDTSNNKWWATESVIDDRDLYGVVAVLDSWGYEVVDDVKFNQRLVYNDVPCMFCSITKDDYTVGIITSTYTTPSEDYNILVTPSEVLPYGE